MSMEASSADVIGALLRASDSGGGRSLRVVKGTITAPLPTFPAGYTVTIDGVPVPDVQAWADVRPHLEAGSLVHVLMIGRAPVIVGALSPSPSAYERFFGDETLPASSMFVNGTQAYDYEGFGSFRRRGGVVFGEGLISKRANNAVSGHVLTLPTGWRPARNLIPNVSTSAGIREIRILTDGTVTVAGAELIEWVSLSSSWPAAN